VSFSRFYWQQKSGHVRLRMAGHEESENRGLEVVVRVLTVVYSLDSMLRLGEKFQCDRDSLFDLTANMLGGSQTSQVRSSFIRRFLFCGFTFNLWSLSLSLSHHLWTNSSCSLSMNANQFRRYDIEYAQFYSFDSLVRDMWTWVAS
jgi:hypothetical protein